jgi:N utilization substance protein B
MTLPGGGRRAARERALGLLYEAATKGQPVSEVLAALPVPADAFAVELVTGVDDHRDELDALIARFARDWRLERMPLIDLTVLRMAAFELVHRPDVPTAAILAEAVALAKRFSTDNSGRFVNGVLASVATEVRPGKAPAEG